MLKSHKQNTKRVFLYDLQSLLRGNIESWQILLKCGLLQSFSRIFISNRRTSKKLQKVNSHNFYVFFWISSFFTFFCIHINTNFDKICTFFSTVFWPILFLLRWHPAHLCLFHNQEMRSKCKFNWMQKIWILTWRKKGLQWSSR